MGGVAQRLGGGDFGFVGCQQRVFFHIHVGHQGGASQTREVEVEPFRGGVLGLVSFVVFFDFLVRDRDFRHEQGNAEGEPRDVAALHGDAGRAPKLPLRHERAVAHATL